MNPFTTNAFLNQHFDFSPVFQNNMENNIGQQSNEEKNNVTKFDDKSNGFEISLWNSNTLVENQTTNHSNSTVPAPATPSNTPTFQNELNEMNGEFEKISSLISGVEKRLSSLESKSNNSPPINQTIKQNNNKQNGKLESEKSSKGKQKQQTSKEGKETSKNKQKEKEEDEDNDGIRKIMQNEIDRNSNDLYELFGVVIHRGGAYGGHYHAFIRHLNSTTIKSQNSTTTTTTKSSSSESEIVEEWKSILERNELNEGSWLDFDDDSVSSIPTLKIANQYQGKSECACMFVFSLLCFFHFNLLYVHDLRVI
jgi:hypothetical protein